MVGRLVDEEAAGIPLVGVPAAEVVGAVLGVEIPVEIDRGDLADRARRSSSLIRAAVGAKR